jgi:phosphoglycolate phosphatase
VRAGPGRARSRLKLAIFDLDGTLADTGRDLADSINELRRRRGLGALAESRILSMVGQGARHLVRRTLPAGSSTGGSGKPLRPGTAAERGGTDRALREFRSIYQRRCLDRTSLYPGVRSGLAGIAAAHSGLRLAVVTNKPRRMTEKILRALGIHRCFAAVLGGDDVARRKPHPLPLLLLMRRFRATGRETLVVGDSRFDMEAGRRAHCILCAVTYGYGAIREITHWHPDFIIRSFSRLPNVLKKLAGETGRRQGRRLASKARSAGPAGPGRRGSGGRCQRQRMRCVRNAGRR